VEQVINTEEEQIAKAACVGSGHIDGRHPNVAREEKPTAAKIATISEEPLDEQKTLVENPLAHASA
jgi:hypothetical protein